MVQKQKITNEEFLNATNELRDIIKAENSKNAVVLAQEDVEMNDEGFETCSEEDVSDDEEALHKKAKNKKKWNDKQSVRIIFE